ncbi:unnamed protein product (macronuclear) [Paramecium tetraurelia]|uniref:Septin-type G domain-containing protein n=1 Tax=Paramecium tetraurelia TaxID=5888 RepID=A0DRD0_PARTE|nr:uncharacterized protein GSPATT00019314001 [Paramecium tetraurelia]CAK85597.1 unnamed protein product [Paramecium tetraurelia]|eukprot:XP_001452994.1 hypothetical protein (macronuclear) [Paramecium tetraurelia strain d4-2]
MQDFKRTKRETSYNTQRTEDFSIINGLTDTIKQSDHKFDEQASQTQEYQQKQNVLLHLVIPLLQNNPNQKFNWTQKIESLGDSYPGSEIIALIEYLLHLDLSEHYGCWLVRIGESTFIDILLKKMLGNGQIIRDSTLQIQEIQGILNQNDLTLNIKFIDTPGFKRQHSLRSWLKLLCGYIEIQFKSYQQRQNQQYEKKEKFQQLSQQDLDERVHVCFYFFSGPRIQTEDLQALKQISELQREINQLKQQFNDLINHYHIDLFKFQCNNNFQEKSQFGPTPSYVIIRSVEQFQVGNFLIYGRKFPRGICDIFNPQHSDLIILYKSLIGHYCLELIKLTDFLYNDYIQKEKQKLKLKQQNQSWLANLISYIFNK